MSTYTVKEQSLFDLSVQMGGSVELVVALALNNNMSITAEIDPNSEIKTDTIVDSQIVNYYSVRNIKPATFSGQDILTLSGIGYMIVEENNIVL